MKLEKFYAESISQAMSIIQKKLGADAVIYSQDKKDHLYEIVAGLPTVKEEYKKTGTSNEVYSEPETHVEHPSGNLKLKPNLDERTIRIQKLNNESVNKEMLQLERRNLLFRKLTELKFSYDFIEQFVDVYSSHCELEDIINDDQTIKLLLSKLGVADEELIDTKRIVALIGPTGVGKTTTLTKLAKRYISRYGNDALGIISTDFQRIIAKNQFQHFGKLLNVQVEYARDGAELKQCIELLDDKQFILIDTAGVNQYDNQKIAALCETIECADISLYLVLPGNLQTDALDQVVKHFKMQNTHGCIITKKDECLSIAPALSVIMSHNLELNYICGGQSIARDIVVANKIDIVSDLLNKGNTSRSNG